MLAVQERRTAQLFYKVCLCWMWLSPALQSKMEEKGEAKLFSAVPCSQKNINYAGSERTGQETGRSRLICFFGACSDCCKQTKVVVKLLCVFLNVLQTTKGRKRKVKQTVFSSTMQSKEYQLCRVRENWPGNWKKSTNLFFWCLFRLLQTNKGSCKIVMCFPQCFANNKR